MLDNNENKNIIQINKDEKNSIFSFQNQNQTPQSSKTISTEANSHIIRFPSTEDDGIIKHSNFNSGRWSEEEHQKFIDGILEYGNEWKNVQKIIKTRSSTQARSHAQKFFLRIKKNLCSKNQNNEIKNDVNVNEKNSSNYLINDNEKFSIKYFFELLNGNDKKEKDKNKVNNNNGKLTKEQKEKFLNFVSKFSYIDYDDNGSNNNNNNNSKVNNSNDEKIIEKNIKKNIISQENVLNKFVTLSKKKIFDISKDKFRKKSFNSMYNLKYNKDLSDEESSTIYKGYLTDIISPCKNNEINSTLSESDGNNNFVFCGKKRKDNNDPFYLNFDLDCTKEKNYLSNFNNSNEKEDNYFIEDNFLFNIQRNRKGSDNFDNFSYL